MKQVLLALVASLMLFAAIAVPAQAATTITWDGRTYTCAQLEGKQEWICQYQNDTYWVSCYQVNVIDFDDSNNNYSYIACDVAGTTTNGVNPERRAELAESLISGGYRSLPNYGMPVTAYYNPEPPGGYEQPVFYC